MLLDSVVETGFAGLIEAERINEDRLVRHYAQCKTVSMTVAPANVYFSSIDAIQGYPSR